MLFIFARNDGLHCNQLARLTVSFDNLYNNIFLQAFCVLRFKKNFFFNLTEVSGTFVAGKKDE